MYSLICPISFICLTYDDIFFFSSFHQTNFSFFPFIRLVENLKFYCTEIWRNQKKKVRYRLIYIVCDPSIPDLTFPLSPDNVEVWNSIRNFVKMKTDHYYSTHLIAYSIFVVYGSLVLLTPNPHVAIGSYTICAYFLKHNCERGT